MSLVERQRQEFSDMFLGYHEGETAAKNVFKGYVPEIMSRNLAVPAFRLVETCRTPSQLDACLNTLLLENHGRSTIHGSHAEERVENKEDKMEDNNSSYDGAMHNLESRE